MPEMNPSENLVASSKIFSGPQISNDDSEFVEVDPTGQYGRYNEVLGKGSFKVVYKGFDEVNGIEVAWNQVKVKDVVQRTEDLERLYSEVNILKALKHKNIIKLYSSWVDSNNDNINFITEIFTSGTLRQYRKKHKHVELKAIKSWARQILRGLLYLHSHDPPIIHRDLKCDNIFVNGNQGEVKIGDLGLATILRQANAAHSVIGTPEFMAPELYEEEYNELVDIYSFGMCVLEMVTSEYPYSECANAAQIYKKVTSGKKPAALEKVKDPEVRSFVNKCLAPASERLPARELLMDSFLHRDLDSETVELQTRSLQSRINEMNDHGKYLKEHIKAIACHEGIDFSKMLSSTSEVIDKNVSVPKAVCVFGDTMTCDKGHQKQQIQSTSEDMSRKPSSSSSGDEHTANSRDFVIKGKRREDDTIHLRLRIRTPEGNFRNIHFPFDVEADTAICVASEMVAELDLSDQDVTAIAEMIDIEIISLVPDWKPGAAFDESLVVDSEDPSGQAFDGDCNSSSAVKVAASEEPFLDPLPICSTPCSCILKVEPLEVATPCIELPTIFGRFEEVPYTTSGSDYSCGSDSSSFSDSCDLHGGGDHEDLESMQSYPVTPKSFCSGVGDGLQVDSPYALSCTFHLQPPSSSDMATEVAFLPFYQQDARHHESVDPSSRGKILDNATNINMDKEGMFEVCDKDRPLLDIDHAKAERENSDKQGDFNIENIANTDTFKSLGPMVGSSIPTVDSCSLLQVGADTEKLGPSTHWRHDFLPYIKDGEVNRPSLPLESYLPRLAASESGESRKMENTETTEIEQRRKEQLQKSIAELEVLTLQGLNSSKPSYLASFSKRFTGGSLQASKAVPTLSQLRQQSHILEKKV